MAKVKSISLHNFRAIDHLSIRNLDKGKLIALSGPPCSGKTTIGEAIRWAHSSNDHRAQYAEDVISEGARKCEVKIKCDGYTIVNVQKGRQNCRSVISDPGSSGDTTSPSQTQAGAHQPTNRVLPILLDTVSIILRRDGRLNSFLNRSTMERDAFMRTLLGLRLYRLMATKCEDNLKWRRAALQEKVEFHPILKDRLADLRKELSPMEQAIDRRKNAVDNDFPGAKELLKRQLQAREDLHSAVTTAEKILSVNAAKIEREIDIIKHLEWLYKAYRTNIQAARINEVLPTLNKFTAYYLTALGIHYPVVWAWTHRPSGKDAPDFVMPKCEGETERFCTDLAVTFALWHIVPDTPGILFLDIQREVSGLHDWRIEWIASTLKDIAAERGTVIVVADERIIKIMGKSIDRRIRLEDRQKPRTRFGRGERRREVETV